MKNIAVLGSTGAIGIQTLNVAKRLGCKIVALATYGNQLDLLQKQVLEFQPEIVSIFEKKQRDLFAKNNDLDVLWGAGGLLEISDRDDIDLIVFAMQGIEALPSVEKAIINKKDIALANKEILVVAGHLLVDLAKKHQVNLLAVDNEMSAIEQCLKGEEKSAIKQIILTASGGPFYKHSLEDLKKITVQDTKHPNWQVGKTVAVDCSTLMNKGFEVIATKWLYDIPLDKISVQIHPQSIVHGLVAFQDGCIKASIAEPNMEIYIQYALTFPQRNHFPIENFNFINYPCWEFFQPDTNKFRCLGLAIESLKSYKETPCVLHAANEVFVEEFCKNRLYWCQIGEKLELFLHKYKIPKASDVQDILSVNKDAREFAKHL